MFILTVFILMIAYMAYSAYVKHAHDKGMQRFEHRIHVNGIRGKSSTTRLIAGALREGGIKTAAKTTGSAARILVDHTSETPVPRKEPDIAEQRRMLKYYMGTMHRMFTGEDYKAVVFECMAINPVYQRYLEEKIMHSTIGVITNIREDHTDVMGETLPEIARSLSNTIPRGGYLVTAETDPELLAILQEECDKRNATMYAVGDMRIAEKHIAKFQHFEYKANVAIALKVAQIAGVSRATALAGMHNAMPDPGAFALKKIGDSKEKTIHWANLFAINDRESFVMTVESLRTKIGARAKRAVILNNRVDRPERVLQFLDIALNTIKADYIFTFGDYETQVQQALKKFPDAKVTVVYMGNSSDYKHADGETLLSKISDTFRHKECILFGAVNIHTPQAQALLGVIEGEQAHAH